MSVVIAENYLQHIQQQMPPSQSMTAFISSCQSPLRRSIRVNTLKISVEDFLTHTKAWGWSLTPIPWTPSGFWIEQDDKTHSAKLGNHPFHQMGLFYIQEASSMLPPQALLSTPLPAEPLVLDMAAAPGSKTTQLAAMLNNQGTIVANEIASSRLKGLFSNIQRCGVSNTGLTHYDGRAFKQLNNEIFDAILLDAPCGGEGTVRKDPNALASWNIERVKQLAELQSELLESAFKVLKPGGTLVYSTCTLSQEENQAVCQTLLDKYDAQMSIQPLHDLFSSASRSATAEGYLHVWPQIYDSEGFFVAKLTKKESHSTSVNSPINLGKFPFERPSKKILQEILHFFDAEFGLNPERLTDHLWQRDKTLWYFPHNIESLIGQIKFDRIGSKLLEIHPKGPKLLHDFAFTLGKHAKHRQIALHAADADRYMKGEDIHLDLLPWKSGFVIVTFLHQVLGLAKIVNHRLKNHLPRDVIISNGNPQFSHYFSQ
ncbi:MAG: 16S rRNA (cytosine(1407)-C(5))-methyltransferase RsmF [Pseudomonadota bacterium]